MPGRQRKGSHAKRDWRANQPLLSRKRATLSRAFPAASGLLDWPLVVGPRAGLLPLGSAEARSNRPPRSGRLTCHGGQV